jgi:hypothetical protein
VHCCPSYSVSAFAKSTTNGIPAIVSTIAVIRFGGGVGRTRRQTGVSISVNNPETKATMKRTSAVARNHSGIESLLHATAWSAKPASSALKVANAPSIQPTVTTTETRGSAGRVWRFGVWCFGVWRFGVWRFGLLGFCRLAIAAF